MKLLSRKNLIPFVLITSLFALWGFANAVTDPMVQAFKKVLELTNSQAAWVQMAFYGGYFSMALPAALLVRKYTYKTGVIIGLVLYAIGALLFYPAAEMEAFWFFCLGLYILTFGLAFLETTANPYIMGMGTKETAIRRLNLAQAFNPVGLLLGLVVAKYYVLVNLQSDDIGEFSSLDLAQREVIRTADLLIIRDPYVMLGFLIILLLLAILLVKMPEVKSEGEHPGIAKTMKRIWRNKKYSLGVVAQMFYVGAQIMCWTYIYQYAEAISISSERAADFQFIAFVLFFVGRAAGTYLLKFIRAEKLLFVFALAAALCTGITISVQGMMGLYSLVGITFFMSIMFPTIYSIALVDLDAEDTKIGAAFLVMAIVGGALMPIFQGMIIDLGGPGVNETRILGTSEVNFSFILPLICFILIMLYSWEVRRKNFGFTS